MIEIPPPRFFQDLAPGRNSTRNACHIESGPTMMVSSSKTAGPSTPNRIRSTLSIQSSACEAGSFDNSRFDKTQKKDDSEITIGSHSIGSPKSVFVPISQSPLQKARTTKHNLLPPSSKFQGILAQWKNIDDNRKERDGDKNKPLEYRFRPIVCIDEQGKGPTRHTNGKDEFPDVRQSTLSSRARKRRDVPFVEIFISDSVSTVSTISYNPRDFDAEWDQPTDFPSILEKDTIINQLKQLQKGGRNEGLSDELKPSEQVDMKSQVLKAECGREQQREKQQTDSVVNDKNTGWIDTNRDLMKETDQLLDEIENFKLKPDINEPSEEKSEILSRHCQDKDSEQLLLSDDEEPKAISLDIDSGKVQDGDNTKEEVACDRIEVKDEMHKVEGEDVEKPKTLYETTLEEKDREYSSTRTPLSMAMEKENANDGNNVCNDDMKKELNLRPIVAKISAVEETFKPPVEFIYIPIYRANVSANCPKPFSRLERSHSSRVRSKSANDKKINDILKKGREKFLKRRGSEVQSAAE